MMTEYSFEDLSSDSLEQISCFLDTKSAIVLYRTSKTIYNKLIPCTGFWKSLCKNQNFQDYAALKSNHEEEIIPKLAWSGDMLHDIEIPQDAVIWRKIFIRGIQMKRNICSGRYELWRLFMTDEESLPVKQMKRETTFQELMSSHRRLIPFSDPNRRMNNDFDSNENFFITIQQSRDFNDTSILVSNDIFVWSWNECQNPKFLYSSDIFPLYPTGLFHTAFLVHKNYLVLMPEARIEGATPTRSMIRVHDLDNNMALVGSYDFPLGGFRRQNLEPAHLRKIGDKAVALCRTPNLNFMFFIFSIPTCELVQQACLPVDPQDPLELDELEQEVLKTDTTLMFSFYDDTFYDPLIFGQPLQRKYGRLLVVDFKQFLEAKQPIKQRLVNRFECNEDYILQRKLIKKDKLVCLMKSGRVVVRDIVATSDISASFVERLSIPCPEPLRPDIDQDRPAVCTSRTGDLILVMRQFVSGRKIHAYSGEGSLRYMIDIDAPELGLERRSGYVTIEMNANFVCAADLEKVVIWNNNTGKRVTTIDITKHYNSWEEPQEEQEWGVWRGHGALDFQEDRIIIVHNGRNFPVAADVLRFW